MASHAPITGAPTRAPAIPAFARRGFLGAMAFAPVAALPLAAARPISATPFRIAEARYRTALDRFNNLPSDLEVTDPAAWRREEDDFLAAVVAVDETSVADWQEFAASFAIACDDGASIPNEDTLHRLLTDSQRLAREGR